MILFMYSNFTPTVISGIYLHKHAFYVPTFANEQKLKMLLQIKELIKVAGNAGLIIGPLYLIQRSNEPDFGFLSYI